MQKILYVEGHKRWAADGPFDGTTDVFDKTNLHLQNVLWYVGNSYNYVENPQCPGGPQMNKNDPNTYYFNQQSYDSSSDIFPPGRGYMHKHGNEIECNLEGKYVTMVSYMSEEAGNDYQFSICSVGLFGYP